MLITHFTFLFFLLYLQSAGRSGEGLCWGATLQGISWPDIVKCSFVFKATLFRYKYAFSVCLKIPHGRHQFAKQC